MIKTIIFSVILVFLSLLGLGIGLLLTGKPKLKKGCGLSPTDQKNHGCKKHSCPVCKKKAKPK